MTSSRMHTMALTDSAECLQQNLRAADTACRIAGSQGMYQQLMVNDKIELSILENLEKSLVHKPACGARGGPNAPALKQQQEFAECIQQRHTMIFMNCLVGCNAEPILMKVNSRQQVSLLHLIRIQETRKPGNVLLPS